MKSWIQRARAAVGIGVTWAVGWALIGTVTGLVTAAIFGFPLLGNRTTNFAVMFGVLGFIGGMIFSGVVRLTEGRHTFDRLSLPRFVAWGAVGGLLLGGVAVAASIFGAELNMLGATIIGVSTLLGAGSAAGTLAVARAAHQQELSSGEAVVDTLAGDAARQRLGSAK